MSQSESSGQVLQQTEAIWKFLDNLSLKNPNEYQSFVDKILKDGAENNLGPPTADFVVETVKLPEVIPIRKYFLNIAAWTQLPKPENETTPVAIATSDIRKEIVEKEWANIIDVTLHPSVFPTTKDSTNQTEKAALIEIILRYIESKFSFRLSRKHKILQDVKYIGNKDNLLNFMCPSAMKTTLNDAVNGVDKNLTFEQVKRLSNKREENEEKPNQDTLLLQQKLENTNNRTTCDLMMHSCSNSENLKAVKTIAYKDDEKMQNNNSNSKSTSLPRPKVEMIINKEQNTIEVTIFLPDVNNVQECDLDITESSLSLNVPQKYELDLSLPMDINIDDSSAKFVKDKKILLVKASCIV